MFVAAALCAVCSAIQVTTVDDSDSDLLFGVRASESFAEDAVRTSPDAPETFGPSFAELSAELERGSEDPVSIATAATTLVDNARAANEVDAPEAVLTAWDAAKRHEGLPGGSVEALEAALSAACEAKWHYAGGYATHVHLGGVLSSSSDLDIVVAKDCIGAAQAAVYGAAGAAAGALPLVAIGRQIHEASLISFAGNYASLHSFIEVWPADHAWPGKDDEDEDEDKGSSNLPLWNAGTAGTRVLSAKKIALTYKMNLGMNYRDVKRWVKRKPKARSPTKYGILTKMCLADHKAGRGRSHSGGLKKDIKRLRRVWALEPKFAPRDGVRLAELGPTPEDPATWCDRFFGTLPSNVAVSGVTAAARFGHFWADHARTHLQEAEVKSKAREALQAFAKYAEARWHVDDSAVTTKDKRSRVLKELSSTGFGDYKNYYDMMDWSKNTLQDLVAELGPSPVAGMATMSKLLGNDFRFDVSTGMGDARTPTNEEFWAMAMDNYVTADGEVVYGSRASAEAAGVPEKYVQFLDTPWADFVHLVMNS